MNRERAKTTTRRPPPKTAGQAVGARRISGELLLDVAGASALLGMTPKAIRGRVERRLLPYRRLQGRVVFVKAELLEYLEALDGVTVEEAIANVAARREPAP